jgi:hypothetical protein
MNLISKKAILALLLIASHMTSYPMKSNENSIEKVTDIPISTDFGEFNLTIKEIPLNFALPTASSGFQGFTNVNFRGDKDTKENFFVLFFTPTKFDISAFLPSDFKLPGIKNEMTTLIVSAKKYFDPELKAYIEQGLTLCISLPQKRVGTKKYACKMSEIVPGIPSSVGDIMLLDGKILLDLITMRFQVMGTFDFSSLTKANPNLASLKLNPTIEAWIDITMDRLSIQGVWKQTGTLDLRGQFSGIPNSNVFAFTLTDPGLRAEILFPQELTQSKYTQILFKIFGKTKLGNLRTNLEALLFPELVEKTRTIKVPVFSESEKAAERKKFSDQFEDFLKKIHREERQAIEKQLQRIRKGTATEHTADPAQFAANQIVNLAKFIANKRRIFQSGQQGGGIYTFEKTLNRTKDVLKTGLGIKFGAGLACFFPDLPVKSFKDALVLVQELQPSLYSHYQRLGTLKSVVDAGLQLVSIDKAGFIASTTPVDYYVDKEQGFSTYPLAMDNARIFMNKGGAVFGQVLLSGPIVQPLDKIFINPDQTFFGLLTGGATLAHWMVSIFLNQAILRYTPLNFTIKPGPYTLGVQFQGPKIFGQVFAEIEQPEKKGSLLFSGKVSLSLQNYLLFGLSMQGDWKNPLGIENLHLSNVGGQVYVDLTTKEIGAAAGETVTVGATGGSAGTTAATTINVPMGFGLTGKTTFGNKLDKHGLFALNIAQDPFDLLAWIRIIGLLDKKAIVSLLENMDMCSNTLIRAFDWMRSYVPEKPSNKVAQPPSSVSADVRFKRETQLAAGDFITAQAETDIEAHMKAGVPAIGTPILKTLDQMSDFARSIKAPKVNLASFFDQLPDFGLYDIEAKVASGDVQIGNIWFSNGLILGGKIKIFTQEALFRAAAEFPLGITLTAYLSPIDLGNLVGLKNKITIEGDTKDLGPKLEILLHLEQIANPGAWITGKIKILPLGATLLGKASVSKNGTHIEATGNIGSNEVSLNGHSVRNEDNKPAFQITLTYKSSVNVTLADAIKNILTAKDAAVNKLSSTYQAAINKNNQEIKKIETEISNLWKLLK